MKKAIPSKGKQTLQSVLCTSLTGDRWHADIKPDNILLVNGKFKLADPGFAKFVNASAKGKEEEHLKEKIYGGTWTYGEYLKVL